MDRYDRRIEDGPDEQDVAGYAGPRLDGDGYTNGTLFFAIIDQGNGYNTLAFSNYEQKWNFTDADMVVSVNSADRAQRQVGISDKLTLLSIDPRAKSVKFYDPQVMGEWPELGDTKIGDNVTIPLLIRTPAGNPVTANVSVPNLKFKTDYACR